MGNETNQNQTEVSSIATLLEKDTFTTLDINLQNKIIDTVHTDKDKDGGIMGKFLGTRPANVSMHIGFILCGVLLLLLAGDWIRSCVINQSINMDLVNVIVPVVTLFFGYIFGKGSN